MNATITYLSTTFKGLLYTIALFFSPIKWLIFIVAISTVIDTAFGIWKSKKQKQEITSKKFRKGFVPKVFSYCGLVMIVYLSDFYLFNELTKLLIDVNYISTKILALTLIMNEVKSMDESWVIIKGYSFLEKLKETLLKIKNIKKEINE